MKLVIQFSVILFVSVGMMTSCSDSADAVFTLPNDELPLENYSYTDLVNPEDVNLLSSVLRLPEFALRNLGQAPLPSSNPDAPTLNYLISEFTTSNGSSLIIPLNLTNTNSIEGVYAQVVGSNQFFDIPLQDLNSGDAFSLGLPTNILEGTFEIAYCVYDDAGLISNVIVSPVNVVLLGTGAIQINLVWDTPTDVDLHVLTPSGEEIYFDNKLDNYGGQLDRDDINGYGPENVFWTDNAPDGEYFVFVHDYESTDGNSNFTITVSSINNVRNTFTGNVNNGDKIEVARFIKSGDNISF